MSKKENKIQRIALIAMLSAISLVLFFLEFPVIPSLSHLKLDFSDVPALVAGVLFGPVPAIIVELVKNLLELIIKGMGTQMGYGNLMNFLVGCAYVVPFSIAYRRLKKKGDTKAILVCSAAGTVTILLVGFLANYLVAPLFFEHFLGIILDRAGLWAAVWGATAINCIKGVMLSVISFPVVRVVIDRIKKIAK